jgi:hypothetical protein
MADTVYLLQFNDSTLFATKNITVAYHTMWNRCTADKHRVPEPYATVRRRLLAENKYVHEPALGYKYQIIQRAFLKKPIQHKIDLFNDTVVKQS